MQVTVSESTSIKDYRVSLRTDDKGHIIHRTNPINGTLKFILVKSGMIEATIIVSTVDRLLVLSSNFGGDEWFFPKHENISNDGKPLEIESGHYSEIPLNDVLEIQIEGSPDTPVELLIRYD